ncbi:MAG: DNA-binding domain-containing protein [Gammaproteobacteria bacterium]
MSGLGRIQHDFQEYLLRATAGIVDHVIGTDRVPLPTRLRIYSDAYYARLTEALQANFPALAEVLGERDFERLAAQYIATHDSRFASIRFYGDELAQFLATEPRYRPLPLLADLARWEWTMAAVFDAADADPVDAGALSAKAPSEWATMRLTFHPSVHVLEFAWNAPQTWKAINDRSARPAASVAREPMSWLLWRHDLKEYFRSLNAAEEDALATALSGETFGEVCAAMRARFREDEAPAVAAGFLRGWIESGMVTAVS